MNKTELNIDLNQRGVENKKIIIFDFDGTLANTLEQLLKIANNLSTEFEYQPVTEEDLHILKQLSAWEILRRSHLSLWKIPFLLRRMRQELNKKILDIELFPQIPEMLNKLADFGCILGIISSNSEINIREVLRKYQIEHLFTFIQSAPAFSKHQAIDRLIKKLKISSQQVIYVGDEIRDIKAAKTTKIKVIAVTWGFNHQLALAKYQPDYLINKPGDIITAINQINLI